MVDLRYQEKKLVNLRLIDFMLSDEGGEKRMKKNEQSLKEILETMNCTNIYIMGILKGEERDRKEQEKIQRNNDWKVPKFDEKYSSTYLRGSINFK